MTELTPTQPNSDPNSAPTVPQSTALAEALVESLSDLMSRDRSTRTAADRTRIIAELRAQRTRWAAAEAKGERAPRQKKVALQQPPQQIKIEL